MQSTVNTFIDFDGTLVHENSSQEIIKYLLNQAHTPGQKALALMLKSPFQWLFLKILGLLTRITGKDSMLWLVLAFFRTEISQSGEEIFTKVADSLQLNLMLAAEYERPFIVLSLGLQPLIERFMELHPELNCVGVNGSTLSPDNQNKPILKKINFKLCYLLKADHPRYYTDFKHEAQVFQNALSRPQRLTTLTNYGHNTLYLLEDIS